LLVTVSGLAQFLLCAFQKLFNKDNDFIIDVNVLRLAFEDRLQPTTFPRDARRGRKGKIVATTRVTTSNRHPVYFLCLGGNLL
jgi:hypothetical protein